MFSEKIASASSKFGRILTFDCGMLTFGNIASSGADKDPEVLVVRTGQGRRDARDEVDLLPWPLPRRCPLVFVKLNALSAGNFLILVKGHDPVPLQMQMNRKRRDQVARDYIGQVRRYFAFGLGALLRPPNWRGRRGVPPRNQPISVRHELLYQRFCRASTLGHQVLLTYWRWVLASPYRPRRRGQGATVVSAWNCRDIAMRNDIIEPHALNFGLAWWSFGTTLAATEGTFSGEGGYGH